MKMLLAVVLIVVFVALFVFFEERAGILSPGSTAPDFSGKLPSGDTVTLASYRGKQIVVLYFYPRDFTPGCTEQACSFRDNFSRIQQAGAVIIGVSSDDFRSHENFSSKYTLPFPLISDTDGTIAAAYGVKRLGGLIPLNKRVTYVIDKEGIIRAVAHHEIFISRHLDDILSSLSTLR